MSSSEARTRLQIVPAASTALAAPVRTGWVCSTVQVAGEDQVVVRFEADRGANLVELTVVPRGAPGPVFAVLEHCQVRYSGRLRAPTDQQKQEVAQIIHSVAAAIDARLAASPGATIAAALGRRREPREIVWGRDGLFTLLGPEIAPDARLGEFRVIDAYPPAHVKRESAPMDLMLELQHEADRTTTFFLYSQRDDSRPCLVAGAHLSFSHLSFGVAVTPAVAAVQTMLALILQLRDHEGVSVRFPERLEAPAPPELPLLSGIAPVDVPDAPGELNLVITADCGQSCSFCSVKGAFADTNEGTADLHRIAADLTAQRRQGVRGVRLNGFDPLAHPRILDIVRLATSLGYASMDVYSPCTLVADRRFAEELVESMPERRAFHVPLYGATAELHDRVVGRAGAFDRVMLAIDHLTELVGAEALSVVTVLTVENLDGLPALTALASERRLRLSAHFPFPTNPGKGDRFFQAAPRATDAAAALARLPAAGLSVPVVEGLAPCVLHRAMAAAGVPPAAWLDIPAERPLPMGAEYRDPHYKHGEQSVDFVAPTMPCPHVARCALLPACSGELLQSYAHLYGTEEFRAVPLGDLVRPRSGGRDAPR
jgi:hypothetical protein